MAGGEGKGTWVAQGEGEGPWVAWEKERVHGWLEERESAPVWVFAGEGPWVSVWKRRGLLRECLKKERAHGCLEEEQRAHGCSEEEERAPG